MANPALRSNSKTPISGASTLLLALLAALGTCTLHAQTPLLTPPPVDSSVTAYIPLTGAERLHRYFHETFLSPGLYIAALGAAGGGQLFNDPPEWGQGTAGYAHRSASLLGLFATHVAIHQAGAAALGYDPRYTHCACKGFFHRSGHAILWSFITRNNEGSLRPDLPVVAAAYGSSMLSMYWYPARFSPLTDGVRLGTQQVGSEVGLNWFREFEPEIRKLLRLKP